MKLTNKYFLWFNITDDIFLCTSVSLCVDVRSIPISISLISNLNAFLFWQISIQFSYPRIRVSLSMVEKGYEYGKSYIRFVSAPFVPLLLWLTRIILKSTAHSFELKKEGLDLPFLIKIFFLATKLRLSNIYGLGYKLIWHPSKFFGFQFLCFSSRRNIGAAYIPNKILEIYTNHPNKVL